MRRTLTWLVMMVLLARTGAVAQSPAAVPPPSAPAHVHAAHDSAFHAMQTRGRGAMGVDQYTSVHRFVDRRDGGLIELRRATDDSAGAARIRDHLRTIARAFGAGDFQTPAVVHMTAVPGVSTLRTRRRHVRYDVTAVPRGAVLRIRTRDPAALAAVHEFLAFQRAEHRTEAASPRAH